MDENDLDEYLLNYQTPESRKQLLEYMINGQTMPFWTFMTEFLNKNIKDLSESIVEDEEINPEEEKDIKRKIKLQKGLLRLPKIIIEALSASPVVNDVDTDSY